MNPEVLGLIAKAEGALKGAPPLGGSILVDFGNVGKIYVYSDNRVAAVPGLCAADCTVTLSLDTLAKLESGKESVVGAVLWGDLKIQGSRPLAEKFGAIVKGAKP